ncbi:MAG: pimeloyl-ACP methyl esterase BioG family protein [Alistipes indistinctus]
MPIRYPTVPQGKACVRVFAERCAEHRGNRKIQRGMEQHWIVKERNRDLIVFALGWASDFHAARHTSVPEGYDIPCTDDYRTIESVDPATVAGYRRIYLFAWSFGVWVSELIFRGIPFYKTVALTAPLPVNNRYGIPPKSFAVTLKGIARTGIEAFNRRTFGDFYDTIAPWLETRPFEEKYEELCNLFGCVGQSLPSFDHMERSRDRASGHHLPAGQRKSLLTEEFPQQRYSYVPACRTIRMPTRQSYCRGCTPNNRCNPAAMNDKDR